MKKWSGGVLITSLFVLLVLRYGLMENPLGQKSILGYLTYNSSYQLHWQQVGPPEEVQNPENNTQVVSTYSIASSLFHQRNFSDEEIRSLHTWNHLKHLISQAEALPHAFEAIKEAGAAWESLIASVQEEKMHGSLNGSSSQRKKEKQCPYSLSKMNASELGDGSVYRLKIPCGLIQGSSITVIGTATGLLGNFRIDLTGEPLPGEPDPPIILHYNVRLSGDKITEDPVIVQNTWTIAHDWGTEERCPSPTPESDGKVDELDKCNPNVGKHDKQRFPTGKHSNESRQLENAKPRRYFPFKRGYPSVAILRVGLEGIQMTVDGKHITSFAYRESLEPWLVNQVRISGDMEVMSVLASGLPTSEDLDHVIDLEILKSAPLPAHKPLDLFIGVFSTANNFKRRMAVRRTWMQYDAVRSGVVAVRFFVGLTEVVAAKYVMKTDDDAFVRVDEVLGSLKAAKVTRGLLYGLINSDSQPHRNPDSKWYISPEEWSEERYPPWAHGPGYVVSRDIAKAVYKRHKKGQLKMASYGACLQANLGNVLSSVLSNLNLLVFYLPTAEVSIVCLYCCTLMISILAWQMFKLEDVAMGIWISDMKKGGLDVKYVKEERVYNEGCKDGYVVAHYQEPREMLCLWQKLVEGKGAKCCGGA
ncbi:hypothetical protein ACLOJK_022362 [Asimina triloba]